MIPIHTHKILICGEGYTDTSCEMIIISCFSLNKVFIKNILIKEKRNQKTTKKLFQVSTYPKLMLCVYTTVMPVPVFDPDARWCSW